MGPVRDRAFFVTHYHRADRGPFQSLSDVADDDLEPVLAGLAEGSRRRFGPRYLALRRATEARAYALFEAAGGRPERRHPHYFVLGESAWFAGLYDDRRAVRIPLAELPPSVTSFTWVDSIAALGLGVSLGVPQPVEEWKQQVHRLDELDELDRSSTGGRATTPASGPLDYDGHQWRLVDQYVEVQLWSDDPVRGHLHAEDRPSP